MQKTNFRFRAVVHDDASTDGTADIVREYAEKYPDIIQPILQTENQYSKGYSRIRELLDERTTTKYAAICEGDDYWTDPLKLQKQVDFLESHPDYSACFHQAIRHYEGGEHEDTLYSNIEDRDYTGIELYNPKHRPPTASILLRSSVYQSSVWLQSIEAKLSFGDIPLFFSCAHEGNVRGMSDVMAVYRMHGGGLSTIFQNGDERVLKFADDNLKLYKIFGDEYRDECIKIYVIDYIKYFLNNLHNHQHKFNALLKVFRQFPWVTTRFLAIHWAFLIIERIKNIFR